MKPFFTALLCTALCTTLFAQNKLSIDIRFASIATCNDGQITLTPDGCPPYTYKWSTGATTQNLTGLAPGAYTVEVTDGLLRKVVETVNIEVRREHLAVVSETKSESTCGQGDGAIRLAPTGSTPLTYQWSVPGATGPNLLNISKGAYTVTITNTTGCSEVLTTDLCCCKQPAPSPGPGGEGAMICSAPLSAELYPTKPSSPTATDGALTVFASGGTPPYRYAWNISTPPNAQKVENLGAGSYQVYITDAQGCTINRSIQLTACDLRIRVDKENPTGGTESARGSIQVFVENGTVPYSFFWSNGTVGSRVTDLVAGTYTVTIGDKSGCTKVESITLMDCPQANLVNETVSRNNPYCGQNNGSLQVFNMPEIDLGWNVDRFYWTDESGLVLGNGAGTVSGLGPGTYYLVAEFFGCKAKKPYGLGGPNTPQITATIVPAQCKGSITVQAQHSTLRYNFDWSTGKKDFNTNTSQVGNLQPGRYCVTITPVGASNCTFVKCYELSDDPANVPLSVSAAVQNASCNGTANGGITLTVPNGCGQVTFEWSGPDGYTANTAQIQNLKPGRYSVIVTDEYRRQFRQIYTVATQQEKFAEVVTVRKESRCEESRNGRIDIRITRPELGPFTFRWQGQGGYTATTEDAAGVGVGFYSVTVTSQQGCTQVLDVSVPCCDINEFEINLYQTNPKAAGNNNGSIITNITSLSSIAATFKWSGPNNFQSTRQDITNLAPGLYCVTVNDGCLSKSTCIELQTCTEIGPRLTLTTQGTCPGVNLGSVFLSATGGGQPYQYRWSNGSAQPNLIHTVGMGEICCTVTEKGGCQSSVCTNVQENGVVSVTKTTQPCEQKTFCNDILHQTLEKPATCTTNPNLCYVEDCRCSITAGTYRQRKPNPTYASTPLDGQCVRWGCCDPFCRIVDPSPLEIGQKTTVGSLVLDQNNRIRCRVVVTCQMQGEAKARRIVDQTVNPEVIRSPSTPTRCSNYAEIVTYICINDRYTRCEGFIYPLTGDTLETRSSDSNADIASEKYVQQEEINIYPNPFEDKITLVVTDLAHDWNKSIILYDVLGRSIPLPPAEVTDNTFIDFDTTSLPEGIYVFRIELKNGVIANKRIVKNKL
jgi:Secretion system C-terminal sorting domain/SprB repeat